MTLECTRSEPVWSVNSLAFYSLPGLELFLLDLGLLLSLYIAWRIAGQMSSARRLSRRFFPGVCSRCHFMRRAFGLSFNPWKCAE